jgi:PhnB protein
MVDCMAKVSIYLMFERQTEEAFLFYRSVFGTEFQGNIGRMGDVPADPNKPPLSEADKNLVMHVALPLIGDCVLMGSDSATSTGFTIKQGNNVYINLEPDTRVETERLFAGLAEGGKIEMPLEEAFWGDYFGSLVDKFGICWMFNCAEKK